MINQSPPRVAKGVSFAWEPREIPETNRQINEIIAAQFPVGTEEERLTRALHSQGFVSSWIGCALREATEAHIPCPTAFRHSGPRYRHASIDGPIG